MVWKKRAGILLSLFLTTAALGAAALILSAKGFDAASDRSFIAAKIFFTGFVVVTIYFQFTSRKARKKQNNSK